MDCFNSKSQCNKFYSLLIKSNILFVTYNVLRSKDLQEYRKNKGFKIGSLMEMTTVNVVMRIKVV